MTQTISQQRTNSMHKQDTIVQRKNKHPITELGQNVLKPDKDQNNQDTNAIDIKS